MSHEFVSRVKDLARAADAIADSLGDYYRDGKIVDLHRAIDELGQMIDRANRLRDIVIRFEREEQRGPVRSL